MIISVMYSLQSDADSFLYIHTDHGSERSVPDETENTIRDLSQPPAKRARTFKNEDEDDDDNGRHAIEAAFSFHFWAMKRTDVDYGIGDCCPWPLDAFTYHGLCSHSSLDEPLNQSEAIYVSLFEHIKPEYRFQLIGKFSDLSFAITELPLTVPEFGFLTENLRQQIGSIADSHNGRKQKKKSRREGARRGGGAWMCLSKDKFRAGPNSWAIETENA
jgi:hypothetical protein